MGRRNASLAALLAGALIGISPAQLTQPADNARLEERDVTVVWRSLPAVENHRLSVGTTAAASDLFKAEYTTETSVRVEGLPVNQTLHIRLESKVGGAWQADDRQFMIVQPAEFINPTSGQVGLSPTDPIRWTPVPNATAYTLHAGSEAGKSDLYSTGEVLKTQTFLPPANNGRTLHLGLWTKIGGKWYSRTNIINPVAALITPAPDQSLTHSPTTFQWLPVEKANSYRLQIWSKLDQSDMQDSGPIRGTACTMTPPATSGPIRTRLWTQLGDRRLHSEETYNPATHFIRSEQAPLATDAAAPLEWQAVPLSRFYSLNIRRATGTVDVYSNNRIPHFDGLATIKFFVPDLPINEELRATVTAHLDGRTVSASTALKFDYRGDVTMHSINAGRWAMRSVFTMADRRLRPHFGTRLEEWTTRKQRQRALCIDFAEVLRDIINGSNLGQAQTRNVHFIGNGFDGHTLVEFTPLGSTHDMILDPTFSLVARNRNNQMWASIEDVAAATRSQRWNDIEFITPEQATNRYYLDYPLLFLNLDDPGARPFSAMPYLERADSPANAPGVYTVGSEVRGEVTVKLDGAQITLMCDGPDRISKIFTAARVELPPDLILYRVNRYVFPRP